ncbi:MAG: class GN sortase [Halioglobus sp.]
MFRNQPTFTLTSSAATVLILFGCFQLSGAASIKAKAWLGPILIERAWQSSLASGAVGVKPWSWADTHPVARLKIPSADKNLLVLAGDSGNALAFGPGHTLASAELGEEGVSVIGGHRDTHFAFLRTVQPGSDVVLETVDGASKIYRIKSRRIVDALQDELTFDSASSALWLVTCYPFDALLPGGSLRYVVEAVAVDA